MTGGAGMSKLYQRSFPQNACLLHLGSARCLGISHPSRENNLYQGYQGRNEYIELPTSEGAELNLADKPQICWGPPYVTTWFADAYGSRLCRAIQIKGPIVSV